jgi:predicted metal-binding membrane protein
MAGLDTGADRGSVRPGNGRDSALPALPLADRVAIWTVLALLTLISWLYLFWTPSTTTNVSPAMGSMPGMIMPQTAAWNFSATMAMFAMWVIMMIAMMIPSASPAITIYARALHMRGVPFVRPVFGFVMGYVIAWSVFSVVATMGQLLLQKYAFLSHNLRLDAVYGGAVLALAGLYQISPFKTACLRHCRSPLGFLMAYWRDGTVGATMMGLRHGLYCIGCCWLLMMLLFVAGVMNLLWIAALSFFVLIEKVIPAGRAIAGAAGIAMVAAGIWMIIFV